jgi:hypothetical protein
MTRNEMTKALGQVGSRDFLSGLLIDAEEDLGSMVCGSLFGDMSDFFTDIFYEKTEMPIHMVFQADGVHLSVLDLADREYMPGVLPYSEFGELQLEALLSLTSVPAPPA